MIYKTSYCVEDTFKKAIQKVERYNKMELKTARIEQNAEDAFDWLYRLVCNYEGRIDGSIDYSMNAPEVQAFIAKFR